MRHQATLALIKFLSDLARRLGVGQHVYVVGGAVRNFVLDPTGRKYPIKDVDVVIDSVKSGRDSAWFAKQVARAIPVPAKVVTNQYGVAIITVNGPWEVDGHDLQGEVIEVANARKESYGGEEGKGYKPHMVEPATIEEDVVRREFSYNTLMWRLLDLAHGPEHAEVIDLTGCGLRDLERRETRCPRDPDIVFSDDPSRLLRAIKFVAKYGFKIPPDMAKAIKRNAPKLWKAPPAALIPILIHDVLEQPTAREALKLMKGLGILDELAGIIEKDQQFASTLAHFLKKNPKVDLILDMLDMGLRLKTPVGFLTREQQGRLREVTTPMSERDAGAFLALLQKPPITDWESFDIAPRDRGRVTALAREMLLENPSLAQDPVRLQRGLEVRMGNVDRTAMARRVALRADKIPGGKAEGKKPSDFDQAQLAKGVKVELEHTDDKDLAREIAMDHLTEFSDYYDRLETMEAEAEGKQAARVTPPSLAIPQEVLKRHHLVPVDVVFGVARPRPGKGTVIHGDMVQDRQGRLWFVGGMDEDSKPMLAKSEGLLPRMKTQIQQARLHHEKMAKAWNGTGDGTKVGLFIPLPPELGEQYPDLEEDDSPSHVTLLYVGNVPKEREAEFLGILSDTLAKEPGPIRAWTDGVDTFTHADKDRTIFFTPIRFSRDIGEIKDRVRVALEEAGFDNVDRSPLAYFPHTTLEYRDGLVHEHGYGSDRFVPNGAWDFDTVQVWGLPKKVHDIPMGMFTTGKAASEPNGWLRKAWGGFLDR